MNVVVSAQHDAWMAAKSRMASGGKSAKTYRTDKPLPMVRVVKTSPRDVVRDHDDHVATRALFLRLPNTWRKAIMGRTHYESYRPDLIKIRAIVCNYFHLSEAEFVGKLRLRNLVFARKVYAWICCRIYGYTTVDVGQSINRDHTSVHHYLSDGRTCDDHNFQSIVESLGERL